MKVKLLVQAGLWLLASSVTMAQTPAKPVAKPDAGKPAAAQTAAPAPADGKTLSLGGGSGGGPCSPARNCGPA